MNLTRKALLCSPFLTIMLGVLAPVDGFAQVHCGDGSDPTDGAPAIEILGTSLGDDGVIYPTRGDLAIHYKGWSQGHVTHNFGSDISVLIDGGIELNDPEPSPPSGCEQIYHLQLGAPLTDCKHTIKLVGTANAGPNGEYQYVRLRNA